MGFGDAALLCGAMLVPQMSVESQAIIAGLATGPLSSKGISVICLDIAHTGAAVQSSFSESILPTIDFCANSNVMNDLAFDITVSLMRSGTELEKYVAGECSEGGGASFVRPNPNFISGCCLVCSNVFRYMYSGRAMANDMVVVYLLSMRARVCKVRGGCILPGIVLLYVRHY